MQTGYEIVRNLVDEAHRAVEDLSGLRVDARRMLKTTLRQVVTATHLANDSLVAVSDFGALSSSGNLNVLMQDVSLGSYHRLNRFLEQMANCLCTVERKYQDAKEALDQADGEIDRASALLDRAAARAERSEQNQRCKADGLAILGVAGVVAGAVIGIVAPPAGVLVGAAALGGGAAGARHCLNVSRQFRNVGQKLKGLLDCFRQLEEWTFTVRLILKPTRTNLESAAQIIEVSRVYTMRADDKTPANRMALANQLHMLHQCMDEITTMTCRPRLELEQRIRVLGSALSRV